MTSYIRSIGGYMASMGGGFWGWTCNKLKTTASGLTESTVNLVLDNISYLKRGSKFSLKKDSDSVITLENLELALDKTNETLASLHLPLVATEASLGQIGVKNDGKHYAIVVSTLDLALELGAKTQSDPASEQQLQQTQEQGSEIKVDQKIDGDDYYQDYSDLSDELGSSRNSSGSLTTELTESLTQFLRTLEARIEKINIIIRDPTTSTSMELSLEMVRFDGTSSVSTQKQERVSTIRIGKIVLKSGSYVVFSFEPGAEDAIKITQELQSESDSNDKDDSIVDEIFSLKRIKDINIDFSGSRVCAKIGIDQVHTMTDLVLAFVDSLITSNEQEIQSSRKAQQIPAYGYEEVSKSFCCLQQSNENLHKSVFGQKIDFFNNINHKEISDKSDFNVCFGEICVDVLSAPGTGRERKESLRLDMKKLTFKMNSYCGLINAGIESLVGEIVTADAKPLRVFEFAKESVPQNDITVYLETDTNLNLFNKDSTEQKKTRLTKGYLVKVITTDQLNINLEPKVFEVLFVNSLLDFAPLAAKASAATVPEPTSSPDTKKDEKPAEPVRNSGIRLSLTLNSPHNKNSLNIKLNVPMKTVVPHTDTKGRDSTMGYMFVHNLINDYLCEDLCVFDIYVSNLSFFSVAAKGKRESSTMGIGFDNISVRLNRKGSERVVFTSTSKKRNAKQSYPILITSVKDNGKNVIEVNNSLNTKTQEAFDYLDPDKVYVKYFEENTKDKTGTGDKKSVFVSDLFMGRSCDEIDEEIKIANSIYDFNSIFKDPYLIYGNIPKEQAKTLNWNYYSSKCVFKCFVELEDFGLDVQPDEIALFFKTLDIISSPNTDMSESYVDLEKARLKVYDCKDPEKFSVLDFPGTKYIQIGNFDGVPNRAIKSYSSSKWFNLYENNYTSKGSNNLIFQFIVKARTGLTNLEKQKMQINFSNRNSGSYPSYLITGDLHFDSDGTFAYVKPLRLAPVVNVFLSISDYLDPPALRHLKPDDKTKSKEKEGEKEEATKENNASESTMKVMLTNAFFVTNKGLETTLFLSVAGGFLLEIENKSNGQSLISAKLGKRVTCAVISNPRMSFFPEDLVSGSYNANLSGHEFFWANNIGNVRSPIFTMGEGTINCKNISVNVGISERILSDLLKDIDSLSTVVDDLMLPNSDDTKDKEVPETKINLLSKVENKYVIKECKSLKGIRETKSTLYELLDNEKTMQPLRGIKTEPITPKTTLEENNDDTNDVKKEAKEEFTENDISEVEPLEGGPTIIRIKDSEIKVRIAATNKAAAHTNDGAIVAVLEIAEAVYSSGNSPQSGTTSTYIKLFAKDFKITDYSNEKTGNVFSDIFNFDEKRREDWQDKQRGETKDSPERSTSFGIFSENKIALYYLEADSRLTLRFSIHPMEVAFVWNEINIVNDYYNTYVKSNKVRLERQSKIKGGREPEEDNGQNDYRILYSSETRVKIQSFHLWPVGLKFTVHSDVSSDYKTDKDYTPLISNSLYAGLQLINIERMPWHLNPIVLKHNSKQTFYKDDLPEIIMAHCKKDYSLGRVLRAVMHVGMLRNALKIGKAMMFIGTAQNESTGGTMQRIQDSLSKLGMTFFEVGADSTNSLFILIRTVDGSISATGASADLGVCGTSPTGILDGSVRLMTNIFKGFVSGIKAITVEPIKVYQSEGLMTALQAFICGIPCTIIRPVEGTAYGISLLFYGAKNSLAPKP